MRTFRASVPALRGPEAQAQLGSQPAPPLTPPWPHVWDVFGEDAQWPEAG